MKRFIVVFMALAMVIFASCASVQSNENEKENVSQVNNGPVNKETVDFVPNVDNVKFLGRTVFANDALVFSYTNSGAAFNISAKRLDVTLASDGSEARFVVFVNDERMLDKMVSMEKSFTVFDGSELVEGEVRVIKVSESTSSAGCILKISTDKEGSISPAAQKDLKIEFIGDSITCGYGVDDPIKENHFKVSTEDGSKTYAYKAAKTLNADYSMVSCSGWGVVSGYSGDGSKQTWGILPNVYGKFGGRSNMIKGITPNSKDWDFAGFVPDIVVVNLGTNDASYTKGNSKKIAEFTKAYSAFIKDIRAKNSDAYIICSLGIMGQDLFSAIEEAVSVYKEETGDEKVTTLKFNQQNMADGIAADWHPSEKTHAKAGAKLVAKINSVLGTDAETVKDAK